MLVKWESIPTAGNASVSIHDVKYKYQLMFHKKAEHKWLTCVSTMIDFFRTDYLHFDLLKNLTHLHNFFILIMDPAILITTHV